MGTGENRDVVYLMKQACNKDIELTISAKVAIMQALSYYAAAPPLY